MEEEAAKHGYELLTVSGERDVKKQADQVDDFITKGVSAIVLNPCDKSSIGPAIKKANEAGIPVFTNDLAYVGDEGKVICHVATDNFQGGELAGDAMVELLGDSGGKVAVIHFPQAESCQMRVNGFKSKIDAHNAKPGVNKIEIVSETDGGGMRGRRGIRRHAMLWSRIPTWLHSFASTIHRGWVLSPQSKPLAKPTK